MIATEAGFGNEARFIYKGSIVAFRFYSNTFSQATRGVAAFVFIIGLMLIGFGIVIIVFPAVFAPLAAMIFFIAGTGLLITALKIFISFRRMRGPDQTTYRDNVTIHELDDFDEPPKNQQDNG